MVDVNNVTFTGRLTADAVSKQVNSSTIVEFSIANNTGFGDYKKTQFFNCVLWGKRGEAVCQYLVKGQMVGITGKLEDSSYTNKEGNKVMQFRLTVNDLALLGSKNEAKAPSDSPYEYETDASGYAEPVARTKPRYEKEHTFF